MGSIPPRSPQLPAVEAARQPALGRRCTHGARRAGGVRSSRCPGISSCPQSRASLGRRWRRPDGQIHLWICGQIHLCERWSGQQWPRLRRRNLDCRLEAEMGVIVNFHSLPPLKISSNFPELDLRLFFFFPTLSPDLIAGKG